MGQLVFVLYLKDCRRLSCAVPRGSTGTPGTLVTGASPEEGPEFLSLLTVVSEYAFMLVSRVLLCTGAVRNQQFYPQLLHVPCFHEYRCARMRVRPRDSKAMVLAHVVRLGESEIETRSP